MRTRTTISSRYGCLPLRPYHRLSFTQVEPAARAYNEHNVRAVITGRRASQGADRASLQPLEVDSTGMLKLNPFFAWSFTQVKAYIDEQNVPRNTLLAKGYKSVGDWHSTQPASADGDASERAGRWAGKAKSECGLHKDFFKMRLVAKKKVCPLFLLSAFDTSLIGLFSNARMS
jgi:phosphoadenosine phosphosulfate reductase